MVRENFGKRKFLVYKIFWSEKILGCRKNLSAKIFCQQTYFVSCAVIIRLHTKFWLPMTFPCCFCFCCSWSCCDGAKTNLTIVKVWLQLSRSLTKMLEKFEPCRTCPSYYPGWVGGWVGGGRNNQN